jgi:hypothetical protein
LSQVRVRVRVRVVCVCVCVVCVCVCACNVLMNNVTRPARDSGELRHLPQRAVVPDPHHAGQPAGLHHLRLRSALRPLRLLPPRLLRQVFISLARSPCVRSCVVCVC